MKKILMLAIPFALTLTIALAQGLSLTVGNSVAGQNYLMKSAQFMFRVNGCVDASTIQVTATAEGLVGGMRRSTPVQAIPTQTQPGVYGIPDLNNNEGTWVVSVTAKCGSETTGAIIPVSGRSFDRSRTQLLSHAPLPAEIETALKTPASSTPQTR